MNMKENMSRSKEVLAAYLRQGAHELGQAFYGPGTAAQSPELGMIATKPPSMVVEGLRGEQGKPDRQPEQESILERHVRDAKERAELQPERDTPDLDRG